MELFIEESLVLRVEGEVDLGSSDTYNHWLGSWEPGESPSVNDFKAFVGEVDVTKTLSQTQIESLKNEMITEAFENE